MKYPKAILAALSVLVLSLAPLAPATAAGPGPWVVGHGFGHFGLGAALAHTVFGLATLPLAIVGVAAAAAQSQDPGYAPQDGQYAPAPAYNGPPAYYGPPPAYYAPPPEYYAPRQAYYPPAPRYYAPYAPAPRYYAPRAGYYGAPAGYYGARPGYHGSSAYQVSRRSGYYHYPR
ncbi:MAG: hypothetical protein ACHQDB_05715 [Steroidobacterales bacterium]